MQKIIYLYFGLSLLFFSACSSFQYKEELVEAYYNLGNAYSDLGKLDESSAVLRRALQIDPSFPSAAYNLGIVHIQSGDYEQGIKVLRELLEQESDNISVMKVLAWGYYKNAESENAVKVYESILKIDSYNIDVLNNISILLLNLEMYEEAYPYLVRLEAAGNTDSNTYYNLGISERELGMSSGLDWFDLAFTKEQGMERNLLALIDALKIEENYKRVAEIYDILIDLDPKPDLYFDKAFVLLTVIEDYDQGIQALEIALQKGFNDSEKINELKSYDDLLDRDKILRVFIDYPLEKLLDHETGTGELPVENPGSPD